MSHISRYLINGAPTRSAGSLWRAANMMIRPRCVAAGAPPSRVKKSRRLMGRTPTQGLLVKYSRSGPCIAAKAGRSSPVRVIFVRSTRSRRSRHVRFAPIATKFGPCGETSLSANSDLTHCSKKDRYSITLSARSTRPAGTSWPIAFAVCRLMTNSNLVCCSTRRSAGFAPRSQNRAHAPAGPVTRISCELVWE
jgi:hypothetical protein